MIVDLKAEQFTVVVDDKNRKFVQFQGRLAKNVTFDIDSKGKPKKIRQYSDPSNPRCIFGILQAYLNAIPSEGPFYRRPLPNVCGQICFSQQTVGKNTLSKYAQTMFEKAGIPWKEQHRNISNHGGKVSCRTTLYDKGFDDQTIKMRSGHRSTAVQNYKQRTPRMLQDISDCLQPSKPQASSTSPPAGSVKHDHDTTECTDCPFSPSQPTAAPTDRKPSSPRDKVLIVVLSPLELTLSHWR